VNKIFYFYVSSFSLLAFMPCFKGCKENEPAAQAAKESAAVHSPHALLVPQTGLPCAARKERTLRKVAKFIPPRSLSLTCGVLRRIVSSLFAALLGGVKWQQKTDLLFIC